MLFLAIVVLWISVKNYKNFLITFIIIPLTLISVVTSYTTIQRLLGYPVETNIPTDSVYVTHLTDHDWIFVWAFPPKSASPRAYSIPNTAQNKKAMEEAEQGQEAGRGQLISQNSETPAETVGQTNGGDYVTYDFIVTDPNNMKGN